MNSIEKISQKTFPDFAFMEPLFAKKFPLGEYFLGRYDVIREAETGIYKFLETNANTPGMITESCHVSKYSPSSPFTTNSPHPSPLPEREGNKGTFG